MTTFNHHKTHMFVVSHSYKHTMPRHQWIKFNHNHCFLMSRCDASPLKVQLNRIESKSYSLSIKRFPNYDRWGETRIDGIRYIRMNYYNKMLVYHYGVVFDLGEWHLRE